MASSREEGRPFEAIIRGCNGSVSARRGVSYAHCLDDGSLPSTKRSLRRIALSRRSLLGQSERSCSSAAACRQLESLIRRTRVSCVALYAPLNDELDVFQAARGITEMECGICLPVIQKAAKKLQFCRWRPDDTLVEGRFGIREPEERELLHPDLVAVPMVAFDRRGTRLGFGGGYYDRTLAAMRPRPVIVGLAFSTSEVEHIPCEDHDVPMDHIVTDREHLNFDDS